MKPSINTFPTARIMVIDDNIENVRLVAKFLEWAGYLNVEVITDSRAALQAIWDNCPDIVLLDLHMPHPNGYEILEAIRKDDSSRRLVPVLVFTADNTPDAKARAFEAGASDFLTKPGDVQEILLRVRNFLEMRRMHLRIEQVNAELEERVQIRTAELHRARKAALESLALTAEFRDDETGLHTKRVGQLSAAIARTMGEPEEFVEALELAAPLHDIGKVAIPDAILLKPGRYDDAEREAMRQHTLIGAKILALGESPLMILAQEIALNHHERWDGAGYPNQIAGEKIPLAARIVAVADVFDALAYERPYKKAWDREQAIAEIMSLSGTHFDPQVVKAFLSVMGEQEFQRAA